MVGEVRELDRGEPDHAGDLRPLRLGIAGGPDPPPQAAGRRTPLAISIRSCSFITPPARVLNGLPSGPFMVPKADMLQRDPPAFRPAVVAGPGGGAETPARNAGAGAGRRRRAPRAARGCAGGRRSWARSVVPYITPPSDLTRISGGTSGPVVLAIDPDDDGPLALLGDAGGSAAPPPSAGSGGGRPPPPAHRSKVNAPAPRNRAFSPAIDTSTKCRQRAT